MDLYAPIVELESEAVRCPFPAHTRMREEAPVLWSEAAGFFVVSRYEDIREVMLQPELYSNENPLGPSVEAAGEAMRAALQSSPELASLVADFERRGEILFFADPPAHTRHRKLVNKAFTSREIAAVEDQFEDLADGLIDTFIADGQVEFVGKFAAPFAATAIAKLFGVEPSKRDDFVRWVHAILAPIGAKLSDEELMQCIDGQVEYSAYFEAEIEDRRKHPRADLITAILEARADDETPFSNQEILGLSMQVIGAGVDTTSTLLGSCMRMLAGDADLQRRLRADPSLIPRFVDEVLRTEAPIQGMFRRTLRDTQLGDVSIPKGAYVLVLFAAANRDEHMFNDPQSFDIDRENGRRHLSFGFGIHVCVGSGLARTESRIAFERLLWRLDDMTLVDEPEFHPSYLLRTVDQLNVRFGTNEVDL